MTYLNDEDDYDETARLLLMEHGMGELIVVVRLMRDMHPELSLTAAMRIVQKYRGFDLRPPTHDVKTGRRWIR